MPFVTVDQITPQRTDWLWTGRLARGHLHIVDGDPGQGKSSVLLDLAARLSAGLPWPDGQPPVARSSVVIVNAEDSARESIQPRLASAGADLSRIIVWHRVPGDSWLCLPGHIGELDALLTQNPAALLVLDPLMAFLDPAKNLSQDAPVRHTLAPLADLAVRHRCAIVLIRHLNKSPGGRALYRGLGSIAFVAACRLAWLIGSDPSRPEQRVLAQGKNNLDSLPPSLAYKIEPALPTSLTVKGEPSSFPRITWLGPSTCSASDLVSTTSFRDHARRRACDFLTDFLKNGPRASREIKSAGRARGFRSKTLERAAVHLRIDFRRVGFGPRQFSCWLLPGQQLPDYMLPEGTAEVEKWLEGLGKPMPSEH